MATSGYGNRLAGGNQFFQGPRGPGWRLAPGGPQGCPLRGSSPCWGGTETLPSLELPTSRPPSRNLSAGPAPHSAAPPPTEVPPTPSC